MVKHSRATEAQIKFELADHRFEILLTDNGIGFSRQDQPDRDAFSSGNGLPNIRKRLETIGGSCELETKPGHGTRVRLIVTLPAISQGNGMS